MSVVLRSQLSGLGSMISNRARQKAGPLVAKVCLGDKEWGINWDGIIRLPEAKSVKDAFVLKLETWSEKGGYVCAVLCLVAQSCPTLCKPTDPPGSSVHRILQSSILEWVAISSCRRSS